MKKGRNREIDYNGRFKILQNLMKKIGARKKKKKKKRKKKSYPQVQGK